MDDTETFEDMINERIWDSSMEESYDFSYNEILPLILEKENEMFSELTSDDIYDPYFSTLCMLFSVNQTKGWSKEELIKILMDIDNPKENVYYNTEDE